MVEAATELSPQSCSFNIARRGHAEPKPVKFFGSGRVDSSRTRICNTANIDFRLDIQLFAAYDTYETLQYLTIMF